MRLGVKRLLESLQPLATQSFDCCKHEVNRCPHLETEATKQHTEGSF